MSEVQFEENNNSKFSGDYNLGQKEKGLIGLLIKIGLAENAKAANIILYVLFFVVVALTISYGVWKLDWFSDDVVIEEPLFMEEINRVQDAQQTP